MTIAQRKARAKRAGAKRRKANAVKAFMRKMNPGKKTPVAVRVKRLKGGGISVTPLKVNAGPLSVRKWKKVMRETGATHYQTKRGFRKFKQPKDIRRGYATGQPKRKGNIAW